MVSLYLRMARIMAFDYGSKRIGIAVTDPLQMIATGLETVHPDKVIDFIKNYIKTEQVEMFVIGEPLQMDSSPSEITPHIVGFIRKLKKLFPEIPQERMDERFTSVMAQRTMIEGGASKKQRRNKGLIDTISATIILQSYLERKSYL
ncbi:MAG: putative Holliday junction resolvase [Sphingobacteriales bacterium]